MRGDVVVMRRNPVSDGREHRRTDVNATVPHVREYGYILHAIELAYTLVELHVREETTRQAHSREDESIAAQVLADEVLGDILNACGDVFGRVSAELGVQLRWPRCAERLVILTCAICSHPPERLTGARVNCFLLLQPDSLCWV